MDYKENTDNEHDNQQLRMIPNNLSNGGISNICYKNTRNDYNTTARSTGS